MNSVTEANSMRAREKSRVTFVCFFREGRLETMDPFTIPMMQRQREPEQQQQQQEMHHLDGKELQNKHSGCANALAAATMRAACARRAAAGAEDAAAVAAAVAVSKETAAGKVVASLKEEDIRIGEEGIPASELGGKHTTAAAATSAAALGYALNAAVSQTLIEVLPRERAPYKTELLRSPL